MRCSVNLKAHASKELLRRFVGWVLGDETTLERPLQDTLSQPGGSLQLSYNLVVNLLDYR